MKKILFVAPLFLLLFTLSCDNGSVSEAPPEEAIDGNAFNDLKLTSLSDEDTKFLIQAGKSLFESGYSEAVYNRVSVDAFKKFSVRLSSREKMLEGLQHFQDQIKEGKYLRSGDSGMSEGGKVLTEQIKTELEKAQDAGTFLQSYETSKMLISASNKVDASEKELIKFNLEVVKTIAMEDYTRNGRSINADAKCKWYQWACVFYVTSTQAHLLLAIWFANQTTALQVYVAAYGIDYIAQCCGFCGCTCPSGCPRII